MTTKELERILILRTILNGGKPMRAKEIADRASVECDHDALEELPPVSRSGIGQKLQAMHREGLLAQGRVKSRVISERVSLWSVTEAGSELARSLDEEKVA